MIAPEIPLGANAKIMQIGRRTKREGCFFLLPQFKVKRYAAFAVKIVEQASCFLLVCIYFELKLEDFLHSL